MKLLKLFLFAAVLFGACSLFAQKPIVVTVWPEANPNDSENRVSSLLWEYFKSELATHSKLKLSSQDVVDNVRKATPAADSMTPDTISKICKETGADILCIVSLKRGTDNKFHLLIRIFTADGKSKAEVKREFAAIRESDHISVVAARDTAFAIRGANPADVINKAREKTLLMELERAEDSKKITD